MRNKQFIIGISFILLIALAILFWVLVRDPSDGEVPNSGDVFGDTNTTRDSAESRDPGLFGDVTELLGQVDSSAPAPQLRLLTDRPVAGAGVRSEGRGEDGDVQTVRYVDKRTGNIYQTPLENIETPEKLSQKTLLRVAHTVWSSNADTALVFRLNDTSDAVYTYLGILANATTTSMSGRPLPAGIQSAVFSPDQKAFAYLLPTSNGTTLYVEQVASGARKDIWKSPLTDLTVGWDGAHIIVYMNPTSYADGIVWLIDPVTGSDTIVLSDESALAAKESPDGSRILFSFKEKNNTYTLRVYDIATKNVVYLPMATIIEKCTWGPHASSFVYCAIPRTTLGEHFVDEFYQGTLATDDVLWRMNTVTGEVTKLVDLYEQLKVRVDVVYPHVSEDGAFLVFQTRRNNYLWSLRLPEVSTSPVAASTEE
jgi:hypothetical protein